MQVPTTLPNDDRARLVGRVVVSGTDDHNGGTSMTAIDPECCEYDPAAVQEALADARRAQQQFERDDKRREDSRAARNQAVRAALDAGATQAQAALAINK